MSRNVSNGGIEAIKQQNAPRDSKVDKRALFSNFISLSIIQGAGFILPLITLPYLVRVLGVETYGLINFAAANVMYLFILVSFGCDLAATREISLCREDADRVSLIFSSVMFVKISLLIFSTILLVSFSVFETIRQHFILYLFSFGIVLGNVLFPSWYFQGIERMKYITYLNLLSRVFFTGMIFIFVQNESDYLYVPLLNSIGSILAGVLSLFIIIHHFKLKIRKPDKAFIVNHVKQSFHIFLSRLANSGSRYFVITIIGLKFNNTVVGYYSMVEKLYQAFLSIGGITSQALYPYMARTRNIVFFKKIFYIIAATSIITLVFVLVWNVNILNIFFKEKNEVMSGIFLIMFSGSIFGILSALLGYPLLGAFGYMKYANNSLIYASIVYISYLILIVSFTDNIYFITISSVIYAFLGLFLRCYYIKNVGLSFWRKKFVVSCDSHAEGRRDYNTI